MSTTLSSVARGQQSDQVSGGAIQADMEDGLVKGDEEVREATLVEGIGPQQ